MDTSPPDNITPEAGRADRVERLLVSILVRFAESASSVSPEAGARQARLTAILRFFKERMRYSDAALTRVRARIKEAIMTRPAPRIGVLLAEFKSRIEQDPDQVQRAYSACLLLTRALYRVTASDNRAASVLRKQARTVAAHLGVFADDLDEIEAQYLSKRPELPAPARPSPAPSASAATTENAENPESAESAESGAVPLPPPARTQADPERFEQLYVNIMVRVGMVDGHFTRTKLRIILEFFQSNMLYQGERLAQVRRTAQSAWTTAKTEPDILIALARLAGEFHRLFNYANRRMLLDHVFQLVFSADNPQPAELEAARAIGAGLRIFSKDLKELEDKYLRQRAVKRLERLERGAADMRERLRQQEAARKADRAKTREERARARAARQNAQEAASSGGNGSGFGNGAGRRHQPDAPTGPPDEAGCYAILKLEPGADFASVKHAWRERVMEYHPDRLAHLGPEFVALAEAKMKAINEAYSFLEARFGQDKS